MALRTLTLILIALSLGGIAVAKTGKDNLTPDQTCALKKIFEAAQNVAKEQFGDRARGTRSATAIRAALEKVGVTTDSRAGAADFLRILSKNNRFASIGSKDAGRAPQGAIIVYSGPGEGEVVIRGEDDLYYADGKGKAPRRPLAGIFIPNSPLAKEICSRK